MAADLGVLVMNAIANDYENLDSVVNDVRRWAAEDRSLPSEAEIVVVLRSLFQRGLARAYRLSAIDPPVELAEFPSTAGDRDVYFLLTSQGKLVLEQSG